MAYYYGVWPLREAPPKGVGQGPIEVNKLTIACNLNRATCHTLIGNDRKLHLAQQKAPRPNPRGLYNQSRQSNRFQAARLEVIVHTELAGVHAFGVYDSSKSSTPMRPRRPDPVDFSEFFDGFEGIEMSEQTCSIGFVRWLPVAASLTPRSAQPQLIFA